jgi:hypothetical protein
MADETTALMDSEIEEGEPIGFIEWARSAWDEFMNFDGKESKDSGNRGPLGCSTNNPTPDKGTLTRGECRPPGTLGRVVRLDPIELKPIQPFDKVKKSEDFEKKFEIGADVYWELGLAGQIAEKFLKLPYRTGKIKFKSGKLEGKGLVCSSFAKIFGALWFAGDPKKQEVPVDHTIYADVRDRYVGEGGKAYKIVSTTKNGKIKLDKHGNEIVVGESDDKKKAQMRARLRKDSKKNKKTISSAQAYVGKYGGSLFNVDRRKLNKLIKGLDNNQLYAVVKYGTKTGESREHVLFLIFSKSLNEWVMIHSPGWARKKGGKGPGPGIYRIPRNKKGAYKSSKHYQAWDWGPAYRPRNPDINSWKYIP